MLRFVLLVAVLLASSPISSAATLFFRAVPTTTTAICPAPCHQIQMFYEDPTRSLEIQALQFDVVVFGGASVGMLPTPPASNSNAAGGNTNGEDPEGNLVSLPWSLASTVGESPATGFDALTVDASSLPLTVDSVLALRNSLVSCAPTSTCAVQLEGLLNGRIYLGRFNVTWSGGPVLLVVGGLTGVGPALDDPSEGLIRLNGAEFSIEGFPPFDPLDSDGDGVLDLRDNCVSLQNPDQANRDRDGLGDACDLCPDYVTTENGDIDGNGIGDACECGDQTGDGTVDTRDLVAINLAIFGQQPKSPLCDTDDDGSCSVSDIVGANAKIFGRPAYCQPDRTPW